MQQNFGWTSTIDFSMVNVSRGPSTIVEGQYQELYSSTNATCTLSSDLRFATTVGFFRKDANSLTFKLPTCSLSYRREHLCCFKFKMTFSIKLLLKIRKTQDRYKQLAVEKELAILRSLLLKS